ncbi:hypothetical protein X735_00395 [Mesorhizobium sp. L2C085B000]|nr:hypothetical protein X770_22220 [Mesorhizobium sp. LSJC269B00]ESZ17518.1 hypothetical protein X735_00395 [Mesorhizobium sp. L2C085B000]ESZ43952.1 hypothetical protein X731_21385 [Mesorhizobium sp. L2C054A000]
MEHLNTQTFVLVSTLIMVGQNLDHPAFADSTMAAAFNHQLELGLQGFQAADTLRNVGEPCLGNGVSRCTRL